MRKLEQKVDADPLGDKIFVTGTFDPTRPKGSPLTDSMTLDTRQSVTAVMERPRKRKRR